MEMFKIIKESSKNGIGIMGFISISINNILKKTENEMIPFKNELDFQYKLSIELKNIFNKLGIDNAYVYVEYHELNFYLENNMNIENIKKSSEFSRIDIVIKFNNEYYPIELKYGYDRNGGPDNRMTNLSQAVIGFDKDIQNMKLCANKFPCINSGYCILLTAEKEYANKYTQDNNGNPLKIDLRLDKWINIGKLSYYIEDIDKNNII